MYVRVACLLRVGSLHGNQAREEAPWKLCSQPFKLRRYSTVFWGRDSKSVQIDAGPYGCYSKDSPYNHITATPFWCRACPNFPARCLLPQMSTPALAMLPLFLALRLQPLSAPDCTFAVTWGWVVSCHPSSLTRVAVQR